MGCGIIISERGRHLKEKENKKMKKYEEIAKIIAEMEDEQFEKMLDAIDKWLFEGGSKSRVNYWFKKIGITEDEYWMWADQ
jgi:hypothetical protein